jgi:hypothetical protein
LKYCLVKKPIIVPNKTETSIHMFIDMTHSIRIYAMDTRMMYSRVVINRRGSTDVLQAVDLSKTPFAGYEKRCNASISIIRDMYKLLIKR